MTGALRPMSLGEILDRTFQIYRARFPVFAGIWALAIVPSLILNIADGEWIHVRSLFPAVRASSRWILNYLVWLGFYHIHSLLHSVFTPAIVQQASAELIGESCSFRRAIGLALRRWRSFFWIGFLKLALGMLAPEILIAAA